ncbi:hypothetical protein JKP88DRAFT_287599 [Tribonema minus]|uniref:Hemerythrin-like domain-containing protein n=1 Tax=Tribonema minus TaxID=303371 RepID=A0A835Z726_9STRA|nr:hypothetical protein JKP88DRAFT_287599 [Tribonema minus]
MATSKGATDRDVVDVLMAKLFTCKDAEDKKKFRHALIKTLVTHSVAEEMFVYPLMQKKLDNGEAKADPMSADFERLLEQLPRDDLVGLVGKVEMAKKVAPTHPHPSADPHAPAFHMLMGPGIGFADSIGFADRCARAKRPSADPHAPAFHMLMGHGIGFADRTDTQAPSVLSTPHAPAFHMLVGPGIGFAGRLRDALSGQTAS